MTPISFKIARNPAYRHERPGDMRTGWIVDGTNDTIAIDERYPAEPQWNEPAIWGITHLPTGRRIGASVPRTQEHAAGIALRFYREALARGWPMTSSDPAMFDRCAKAMSREDGRAFWAAVLEDWECPG